MFKCAEDVALEFRRRVRRDPDPVVWDYAITKGLVADAINHPEEVDSVIENIREMEAVRWAPREKSRGTRKELPPDQRAVAMVHFLAEKAAGHRLVQSFRRNWLGGQFIEPTEIKAWIEERAREQGEPARRVQRWERVDGVRVGPLNLKPYGPKTRFEFGETSTGIVLQYPGGSVPLSPESVLGQLKFTANALREEYPWPEGEIVGLILSGMVPSPFFGSVTIRETPSAERIMIEVDPRVPARDVLQLYQWARDAGPRKTRALSERHAALAVFAFERNDGREWNRVLAEWNETHPQHAYGELRNFIRDCRTAHKRVTGNTLLWKRKRGGARRPRRARHRRERSGDVSEGKSKTDDGERHSIQQ